MGCLSFLLYYYKYGQNWEDVGRVSHDSQNWKWVPWLFPYLTQQQDAEAGRMGGQARLPLPGPGSPGGPLGSWAPGGGAAS